MTIVLTPAQKKLLRQIEEVGHEEHATPMEEKAAAEIGIVESNLSNPSGGDADSGGWRQERASLYSNPTNVLAAAHRVFQEMHAARASKKYTNAGDLAADVQRPAEQYRGRYNQRGADAASALAQIGMGNGTQLPVQASPLKADTGVSGTASTASTKPSIFATIAGLSDPVANPDYGLGDTMAILERLKGIGQPSTPAVTSTSPSPTGATPSTVGASGEYLPGLHSKGSGLFELFYDPQGGWKKGQSIGAIGGHSDHVHVAAGHNTILAAARLAQKMGLHVGELPPYDKVDPVHVSDSYHYKDEAGDMSGTPEQMAAYTHKLRRMYGLK